MGGCLAKPPSSKYDVAAPGSAAVDRRPSAVPGSGPPGRQPSLPSGSQPVQPGRSGPPGKAGSPEVQLPSAASVAHGQAGPSGSAQLPATAEFVPSAEMLQSKWTPFAAPQNATELMSAINYKKLAEKKVQAAPKPRAQAPGPYGGPGPPYGGSTLGVPRSV